MIRRLSQAFILSVGLGGPALVPLSTVAAAEKPAPTHADVPYGDHERQKVDVYPAKSDKPTPVIVYIHGGGWMNGDKGSVHGMVDVAKAHEAGVSVVAVNYRLIPQAEAAGIDPPVLGPLGDAARAIQFVRSKAGQWNLDPARIGACGGSAGACTSLWLAMHDDMAEPESTDPVARQSTRLTCAAVSGAQTSLDPVALRQWMPNMRYGGHAFGFKGAGGQRDSAFQQFHDSRDEIWPEIRKYSPIEQASADDPPIYLVYGDKEKVVKGSEPKDPTHSALLGQMLVERLRPLGVDVILDYPGEPDPRYASITEYLIDHLRR